MSSVVLSAAVRQNLLSLQSTADLLSTTQNRLSTGKKVNSALDNPTNFFTAQGLDNRASDINNLLDGVANGVQVLQAANTGITSLQKLVDNAKSIANQALQSPIGYSTKSNVSATIAGATTSDLNGTTTYTNAFASSNVIYDGTAGGTTAIGAADTLGGVLAAKVGSAAINGGIVTYAGTLNGAAIPNANLGIADGDVITVNGKTITFNSGTAAPTSLSGYTNITAGGAVHAAGSGGLFIDSNHNAVIYLGAAGTTATMDDLMTAIDVASGVASFTAAGVASANASQTASTLSGAGIITLNSSTGADLSISGKADILSKLKLTTATGSGSATVSAYRATSTATLGTLIQDGSKLFVNGKTITFSNAPTPAAANVATGSGVAGNVVTDGKGNSTVYLQTAVIGDVLKAIDLATGTQTATIASGTATLATATGGTNSSLTTSGTLKISTFTSADLEISGSGNALAALGLAGNTGTETTFAATRTSTPGSLSGKTLTFTAFNGGTAVNVTFGDGSNGTVKSLTDLNKALQANNMIASLDAAGKLTISAGNDYASSTLGSTVAGGTIGGTATTALTWANATAPVEDTASQATRANLVNSFNNILDQVNKTAQDASYNGVNLLWGDQLQLVFNETGTSKLNITGVTYDYSGLGLSQLTAGTDFIDNDATSTVLTALGSAQTNLRSLASTLGSNLSIVQTRQDFSKNLINVLQTGSSNLTLADTNEEAANSQALSTRQSIAVSALALANTAQQQVLQLLR